MVIDHTFVNSLLATLQNSGYEKLQYSNFLNKRHEADFGPNTQNQVLQIHLFEDEVFIFKNQVVLDLRFYDITSMFLFVILKRIVVKFFKQFVGWSFLTVKSSHFGDQELEDAVHVFFGPNDKVNISAADIDGQALPAIEWNIVGIIFWL